MRLTKILAVLLLIVSAYRTMYFYVDADIQAKTPLELKAQLSGMTVEEFELMSAVVEAESNREFDEDGYEGRVLIALTILNRVESSQFNNSITSVIQESGQFQVYYQGTYKDVGRTDYSDRAIVEAAQWAKEEHPNVIYFNCIGFSPWAEPYEYVGGNYFSLGD